MSFHHTFHHRDASLDSKLYCERRAPLALPVLNLRMHGLVEHWRSQWRPIGCYFCFLNIALYFSIGDGVRACWSCVLRALAISGYSAATLFCSAGSVARL